MLTLYPSVLKIDQTQGKATPTMMMTVLRTERGYCGMHIYTALKHSTL